MFTLTLTKRLYSLGLITAICMSPFAASAEEFLVSMLNTSINDVRHTKVFALDIL